MSHSLKSRTVRKILVVLIPVERGRSLNSDLEQLKPLFWQILSALASPFIVNLVLLKRSAKVHFTKFLKIIGVDQPMAVLMSSDHFTYHQMAILITDLEMSKIFYEEFSEERVRIFPLMILQ